MKDRVPLRFVTVGLVLSLIIMTFAAGCNLMGTRTKPETQPSPTRPTGRRTRTPLRPMPTKRTPGMTATDTSTLRGAIERVRTALARNDWAAATREADRLGMIWTKFKPSKRGTMSATEMKDFDVNYAKLQKDCRMKKKSGCERDIRALTDTVARF